MFSSNCSAAVDRLGAMRGAGESYSDVILRLAAEDAVTRRLSRAGD